MDPDICYHEYLEAMNDLDLVTAKEERSHLMEWLNKGGFEPNWTPEEKYFFLSCRFK